jgi:hypothetical protein
MVFFNFGENLVAIIYHRDWLILSLKHLRVNTLILAVAKARDVIDGRIKVRIRVRIY